MARLTYEQTYAYARQAGFDPAAAVVATAIAMGESGLITDRRGDLGLQTPVWGPSVGLMQIRTEKASTGTGGDRDISRLDDPLQNMIAAYHISSGGKDWSPWTVYNTGKYRDYLGAVTAAAGGAAAGTVTNTGTLVQASLLDTVGDRLQPLGLTLLAVSAGLVAVIVGGWVAVGRRR